ncbi:hypothetical protein JST99_00925 [Candidatus Dependentiae bacterium]|nr:hypothetical protein [Candidatus Dependentiae bacterium]MCC7414764.1 hypothetical protein [Campylobacterota bacterium]
MKSASIALGCIGFMLGFGMIVMPVSLSSYCKYSFIWYDFGIIKKDPNAPVYCIAPGDRPFTNKIHYSFIDTSNKGVKMYRSVQLNLADRRHLRKALEPFTAETKVNDELITRFAHHNGRMKKEIVAWILRDFQKVKAQATVGDVRVALRL